MDLSNVISIIMWLCGGLVFLIVTGITYAFNNLKRITQLEEKVSAADTLIGHLVKAGENIKEQLNLQQNAVVSIQKDINSIDKNLEAILLKMDVQDKNILAFYRDFDIKRKDNHDQ